uniref:ACB domain-containing protein n=1 Tax=Angiostrongylus cantonensis TaxID=6313 RepID=A0A0K0DFE6_ANGCA
MQLNDTVLKHEFELLIRFEEETYPTWGLYQQAVVGNINKQIGDMGAQVKDPIMLSFVVGYDKKVLNAVTELDYMDPVERSWMWSWIKGNKKWHAWNKCKGLTKEEAMQAYIESVRSLEERLPDLLEEWKDDQDPRIPDRNRYVPEEERDEVERITREAKLARRSIPIIGFLTIYLELTPT